MIAARRVMRRHAPTRGRNDTGTDAVSYFDVGLGTGYDFLGQSDLQADDLEIQFTVLGDGRLAVYFFSPANLPPGDSQVLHVIVPETTTDFSFPLARPDQIAGLKDGTIAVLREGGVTSYGADGTKKRTMDFPGRVTAIAAVPSGALAFVSEDDLYCARGPADFVRVTDTPTQELLFP